MMAALAAAFAAGFGTAARALCWVAGAASAVLLALVVVLVANVALQYIFDHGTDALATAILKGGGDDGPGNQKENDKVP